MSDTNKAELDRRHKAVNLEKAQLELRRLKLQVAEAERKEQEAQADPGAAKIYTFYGGVDAGNVKTCMATLGKWSRISPKCPITLIFNSPGGSVSDGLALFDYIQYLRSIEHEITIVALGRAASMGGILLQAGDKRIIGANSMMLIHEVSAGTSGKVSEMEDSVRYFQQLQKILLRILAERSKLSIAQIKKRWKKTDWWLGADEVVELGFADEIQCACE